MPVDGANLQGANVRQVVVQADAAALMVRPPPPTDSVVRPLAHLGERLQAEKNQSVGEELVVQRQDENPEYSAGDALNGDGRHEGGGRKRHREGGEDAAEAARDEVDPEPWSSLGDPAAAQERLKNALDALPFARIGDVFRGMDRSMLTGLLLPAKGGVGSGLATYQRQTIQILTAVEAFRMAVHGAQRAAETCSSGGDPDEREKARKLVSLARQAVRSESDAGRELSAFLDEALLEVSRSGEGGALRSVMLLGIVDSAISLWRDRHNVGTVPPWSLP